MKIFTFDDITGDGAAHSLATLLGITSQLCTYYRLSCIAVVAALVRAGDEDVSATNGVPFGITGLPTFFETPVNGQDRQITYDLANVWVYIPNGQKLSVAYGI